MDRDSTDIVLLICNEEAQARRLLERLISGGVGVIGPIPTASLALALAAQAAPTVAVVAQPPAGKRSAKDLAECLMKTWGVRSFVLPQGGLPSDCDGLGQAWSPKPEQLAQLRRVLGKEALHGCA